MASVDGKKSYPASSEEILQHVCRPCQGDGEIKEAKHLCEVCKDYLCFDCSNDHKTFKATKHHSIVAVQVTKGGRSTTTKGTFAILCGCDQKRAVEVYCEKHGEVICPTCGAIKHRSCITCPIKDKVSRNTKKQLKELMDKAKLLQARAERCKKDGEENHKKVKGSKEECKKEILAYRNKLDQILDKMKAESLEELDTKTNQQLERIKKNMSKLTTSQQELERDLDFINKVNRTNDEDIMFSGIIKLSKSLSAYEDLILETRHDIHEQKFEFHKHETLFDVLKSSQGLGSIQMSETDSIQQDCVAILDMKVKSRKEINIELETDNYDPSIFGCTFLSNDRILLCDYWNKTLKLLDSKMSITKSLNLSEFPYNVAAVGENEAIITFELTNDLQYIDTHPDLKLGKTITLPDKCYGLCIVNDNIYTAYHKDTGKDEIWRLDRAGNILSKTVLNQTSSSCSNYLGFCQVGPSACVYLTDTDNSRVTCFQLDGKIVYQYQDKGLKWPFGIYVDTAGNCLVCGSESDNVVVITADGRKHRQLLTPNDIREPRCIDYRPEDQTLIVGCVDNSKLFVYKLGF